MLLLIAQLPWKILSWFHYLCSRLDVCFTWLYLVYGLSLLFPLCVKGEGVLPWVPPSSPKSKPTNQNTRCMLSQGYGPLCVQQSLNWDFATSQNWTWKAEFAKQSRLALLQYVIVYDSCSLRKATFSFSTFALFKKMKNCGAILHLVPPLLVYLL